MPLMPRVGRVPQYWQIIVCRHAVVLTTPVLHGLRVVRELIGLQVVHALSVQRVALVLRHRDCMD